MESSRRDLLNEMVERVSKLEKFQNAYYRFIFTPKTGIFTHETGKNGLKQVVRFYCVEVGELENSTLEIRSGGRC